MTVKIEDLKAIKILENGISLMEDSKKDNPEMIVFLENEVNLYHKAIEELCDIFKEFEDK